MKCKFLQISKNFKKLQKISIIIPNLDSDFKFILDLILIIYFRIWTKYMKFEQKGVKIQTMKLVILFASFFIIKIIIDVWIFNCITKCILLIQWLVSSQLAWSLLSVFVSLCNIISKNFDLTDDRCSVDVNTNSSVDFDSCVDADGIDSNSEISNSDCESMPQTPSTNVLMLLIETLWTPCLPAVSSFQTWPQMRCHFSESESESEIIFMPISTSLRSEKVAWELSWRPIWLRNLPNSEISFCLYWLSELSLGFFS